MLEIDFLLLPSNASQVMMMRGSGRPGLSWNDGNRTAKGLLDGHDDEALLAPASINDEAMAAAVRALLYLWSGWPEDARMHAAAAPAKESIYVALLAERHAGRFDQSKTLQGQLEGHEIYPLLAGVAKSVLTGQCEPPLRRFRDLIELAEEWEPFAFTDLYARALDDQMSHTSLELLQTIQWHEFNVLLHACFKAATAIDIQKQKLPDPPTVSPRRLQTKRSTPAPPTPIRAAAKPAPNKIEKIRVGCPKCRHVHTLDLSARGRKLRCAECSATFNIPLKMSA